MRVKSKVWLEKADKLVFGVGKDRVLKAIQETGSINKAARKMNMSYRHAWSYIVSAEKRIGRPLVIRIKGGSGGGGAVLTPYAKTLLESFEKLEHDVEAFVNRRYREIFNIKATKR